MARFYVYEHSKFAGFLSFFGWIGIVFGVYSLFNEELGWKIGVVSLAIAFVLKLSAFLLNRFIGRIKSKRTFENDK